MKARSLGQAVAFIEGVIYFSKNKSVPHPTVKKQFMALSEKEVRALFEARLSKYFHLYPEVSGRFPDGKAKRIDLIVVHKHDDKFRFGIEIKKQSRLKGQELAKFCKQAAEYTKVEWIGFGRVPILIYPELSWLYFDYFDPGSHSAKHSRNHEHHNFNSFLAEAFGIGEVRTVKSSVDGRKLLGFRFANKSLWREFDYGTEFSDKDNYLEVLPADFDDTHTFNYSKLLEKLNISAHE